MWIEKGSTIEIDDPRPMFGGTYTVTTDSALDQGTDGNRFRAVGTLAATPKNLNVEFVLRRIICPEGKPHTADTCRIQTA